MGSGIPHLPAAMGVCGPSGVPGSDGGFGEAEKRCGSPRGTGSSKLSVTGAEHTAGPLWPWVHLTH